MRGNETRVGEKTTGSARLCSVLFASLLLSFSLFLLFRNYAYSDRFVGRRGGCRRRSSSLWHLLWVVVGRRTPQWMLDAQHQQTPPHHQQMSVLASARTLVIVAATSAQFARRSPTLANLLCFGRFPWFRFLLFLDSPEGQTLKHMGEFLVPPVTSHHMKAGGSGNQQKRASHQHLRR